MVTRRRDAAPDPRQEREALLKTKLKVRGEKLRAMHATAARSVVTRGTLDEADAAYEGFKKKAEEPRVPRRPRSGGTRPT